VTISYTNHEPFTTFVLSFHIFLQVHKHLAIQIASCRW